MDAIRTKEFMVVEWFDAATYDGWMSSDSLDEMVADRVFSAGWLERLTEGEIVLSGGYSDGTTRDGEQRREFINTQVIPRRMVVAVYRVPQFQRGRLGKSTKEPE